MMIRAFYPTLIGALLICAACNTTRPTTDTDTVRETTANIPIDTIPEEVFDTQRLPEGVTKPEYAYRKATPATGVIEERVDPPNWWVGMAERQVELMMHGGNIGNSQVRIDYPGVSVKDVVTLQNPNYLFVMLDIAPGTQPGEFDIILSKGSTATRTYAYELRERGGTTNRLQGLTTSDFVYLIMPDRFANGDTSNDDVEGMAQRGTDRSKMYFRHGGDLEGIIDKLDYLEELSVTAIWLNPVQTNDEAYESYHGYAVTDHYEIDPRFGTNEDYKRLVDECHKRGIKVVMDIVHNHVGDQHYFIKDLPSEDWIHQFEEFQRTSFRAPVLMDPYKSQRDSIVMVSGWFDDHMPDLNQRNPHVARYFIQNNLWWLEWAGIDAYRIDTYAYPDQAFMSDWGARMQKEYPTVNFFGETWVHGPAVQAQFTQNNNLRDGYNSNMPAVTDFQLYYAINDALNKPMGWTEGVSRIYYTLAQDFLYEDPYRNVVFLDNHDLSRFYSMVGENDAKFRSGLAFLMTMRGIPQLYYGTEILMKNYSDPDGKVRSDFPGGWAEDRVNKFEASGRTAREQAAFEYLKRLAAYRKANPVLHDGDLTQFVPEQGLYVYVRHNDDKAVMVLMNTESTPRLANMERYREFLPEGITATNIMTGEQLTNLDTVRIEAHSTLLIELR